MWLKGQTFVRKKSFELISLFPHGPISTGLLQPQEVLCINQSWHSLLQWYQLVATEGDPLYHRKHSSCCWSEPQIKGCMYTIFTPNIKCADAQCILDVHDASVPGAVWTQSSRAIIPPGFQSYQAETACTMESGNPGTGSGHDWTSPSWGPSCTVYGADTIAWYCDWKPIYLTSQTQMHSRPTLPEILQVSS